MRDLTQEQAQRLLAAAMAWRAQGHRSRWSTAPSLALVDLVDQLTGTKRAEPQDLTDLERLGAFARTHGTFSTISEIVQSEPTRTEELLLAVVRVFGK